MKRSIILLTAAYGLCAAAEADIWRWTDINGGTHFVDSYKPIYTWADERGDVHFSDKPGHPDAVRAHLVWHSTGTDLPEPEEDAIPGETVEERQQRLMAEAYYCNQAKDIYETYRKAPQLYRSDDDGNKVYLTVQEMAEALADAEETVALLCG